MSKQESKFNPGDEVRMGDKSRRPGQIGCVVQVVYSQPVVYVVEWNDSDYVAEYGEDELELVIVPSTSADRAARGRGHENPPG